MPAAKKYISPKDQNRKVKGDFSSVELSERTSAFERNSGYYDGEFTDFLVDDLDTNVKNNIVINMVRQIVDRTVSFIFPKTPKFELDSNSAAETDDEKYLRQTFEANGDVALLSMIAFNGALGGHNFVRIARPDPFSEDGGQFPQVFNLDPRNVQVYWKAGNMRRVMWYEVNWHDGDAQFIEDIILNEQYKRWDILTYKRDNGNAGWELVDIDRWDSLLAPIVDWQHLPKANAYYGLSEISKDVERLNDTINRVSSDIGLILRFHASPRTVAIGVTSLDIEETSVDGLWSIAAPDAQVFNLEMASDLQSSMQFLNYLNEAVLAEARVVIMHGSVKDFQRVTNTGIRAVFLDMLSKNEILRANYGNALKKICRRILAVGGRDEMVTPEIIWTDPLPADQTELINVLGIELERHLVSMETASKKRGYNWNDEMERMKKEASFLKEINPIPQQSAEGGFGKGAAPIKTDSNEVKR